MNDNLNNIKWLQKALRASRAVCRVVNPNGETGTGFLTKEGYLFTSSYVISSEEVARDTHIEFNLEDGGETPISIYTLNAADFITSPLSEYGFTRVKVIDNPDVPLSQWGFVDFAQGTAPFLNTPVHIIQYPTGEDKHIPVQDNEVVAQQNQYLYYTTETVLGSTGASVFNNDWEVVALHYARIEMDISGQLREVGMGILFRDIFAFLARSGKERQN